ncbi:MAG: metallophosphoesterase [Oscillospiraceae bacterium]|nr:metallophosphoesterase [Oscillospiraceae bacterium]
MRRLRLLCGLALALLLGLFSGSASADYRIAVASDPHYIAPGLTDGGLYYQSVLASGDSKFMPYSEEILDAFVEELLNAEEVPDALLLTGDLTFNGAVMSHEALAEKLRPLKEAGIRVLVTTGNHDVYNLNAARFEGESFTRVPFATTELFREIYGDFGFDDAVSTAPDSLSYMAALGDRLRVLVLDFNTLEHFCGISEETLAWAEEQLRTAEREGVPVIAAGHQNLFRHSLFYDGYVISGAERLADLLRTYGVRLFLSGHLHIQHIRTEGDLTEIASSALCSWPCQYGMLTSKDGIWSYETRRLDMAAWADRNGRTEPVFQDFQAAAAEYMSSHSKITLPPGTEEAERERMLNWMRELNLAYFAGDLRNVSANDPDGSLAEAWLRPKDLTAAYVAGVLEELGSDYTVWTETAQTE